MRKLMLVIIVFICTVASLPAQAWTLIDSFQAPTPTDHIRGLCFVPQSGFGYLYVVDGERPGSIGKYYVDYDADTMGFIESHPLAPTLWGVTLKNDSLFVNEEESPTLWVLDPWTMGTLGSIDLSGVLSPCYKLRGISYSHGIWALVVMRVPVQFQIVLLDSTFTLVDTSPVFNHDGRNSLTGIYIHDIDGLIYVNAYTDGSLSSGATYALDPTTWAVRAVYDIDVSVPEGITWMRNFFLISGFRGTGSWLYRYEFEDTLGIDENSLPNDFSLSAYPNPFNSAITISLSAGVGASDARSGQVGVKIFDIAGHLVADLPVTNCGSPQFVPTPQIWQPEKSLGSGIYLVRTVVGEKSLTKRILYVK
ncbi:T9SS type A sorting domain-containing protein [bacterium]|nr:T9SS type A sorting domain-containing protein [bacterium]